MAAPTSLDGGQGIYAIWWPNTSVPSKHTTSPQRREDVLLGRREDVLFAPTLGWKDVFWRRLEKTSSRRLVDVKAWRRIIVVFWLFYVEKTSLRRCMYVVCRRCLNVIFKVEKTSPRRRRFYLGVFKVKDTSLRRCMYVVSRHPLDVLFGLKRRLPDVVYTSLLRHL